MRNQIGFSNKIVNDTAINEYHKSVSFVKITKQSIFPILKFMKTDLRRRIINRRKTTELCELVLLRIFSH